MSSATRTNRRTVTIAGIALTIGATVFLASATRLYQSPRQRVELLPEWTTSSGAEDGGPSCSAGGSSRRRANG